MNTELVSESKRKNTNMGLDAPKAVNYRFGMSHLQKTRLNARLSQTKLAKLAGTSQPQIKRLEAGERTFTKKWAQRLAPHLKMSAESLMFGPRTVKAVSYVGTGAQIKPIDDHTKGAGLEEVEIPPGVPDNAVLVIVHGTSMRPRYFDGEYLFYVRDYRPPTELIGRECVVKLLDGRMYVKVLRKGSEPRLFNLESWSDDLIENQAVEWATPVLARVNRR